MLSMTLQSVNKPDVKPVLPYCGNTCQGTNRYKKKRFPQRKCSPWLLSTLPGALPSMVRSHQLASFYQPNQKTFTQRQQPKPDTISRLAVGSVVNPLNVWKSMISLQVLNQWWKCRCLPPFAAWARLFERSPESRAAASPLRGWQHFRLLSTFELLSSFSKENQYHVFLP